MRRAAANSRACALHAELQTLSGFQRLVSASALPGGHRPYVPLTGEAAEAQRPGDPATPLALAGGSPSPWPRPGPVLWLHVSAGQCLARDRVRRPSQPLLLASEPKPTRVAVPAPMPEWRVCPSRGGVGNIVLCNCLFGCWILEHV